VMQSIELSKQGILHGLRAFTSVAILGVCFGCANDIATPPPEAVPGERAPYVLGVTDVVQITVWKNPELGVQGPVRPDGMISAPLLDDVQAEGLTPHELKEVLTEALSEYVMNPDVTVMVVAMNSNVVSMIGGGLPRSGLLPLQRETRVLEAIATMGGFTIASETSNSRTGVGRTIESLHIVAMTSQLERFGLGARQAIRR
jgi:polysaccharide export outer membrane protein